VWRAGCIMADFEKRKALFLSPAVDIKNDVSPGAGVDVCLVAAQGHDLRQVGVAADKQRTIAIRWGAGDPRECPQGIATKRADFAPEFLGGLALELRYGIVAGYATADEPATMP